MNVQFAKEQPKYGMLTFFEWLNEVTAYHWTPKEDKFDNFDDAFLGDNSDEVPSAIWGHWFSLDKADTEECLRLNRYGRVITANLNVNNLFNMDEDEFRKYDSGGGDVAFKDAKHLQQQLIAKGYDGIKTGDWICVFDPTRIKIIG